VFVARFAHDGTAIDAKNYGDSGASSAQGVAFDDAGAMYLGGVINGTVVNSVLSPGVRVDVGAVVRDSIIMFDTVIRTGAVVDRAIIDKEALIGPGRL